MTPQDLIAAFDTIAEAPEGVKRLRELVLQLAVRGKLVPQDPSDESADVLLARVLERIEADRPIGPMRRGSRPRPTPQDAPYGLPSGWRWTCNTELGETSPRNDAPEDAEVGFAPMALIPTELAGRLHPAVRRWADVRKGFVHLADGDVAVAKITPCFQNGKSCVLESLPGGIGAGTTELNVLRPHAGLVNPRYLLIFFKSPDFIQGGVATFTGTAGQQRISTEYFRYRPVPLPPLAEQHRIVARVDELMGLLDRLEAARDHREELRRSARDAALAALRDAEDSDAVELAWTRIARNMNDVFTSPRDVEPLRRTILALAVTGRLVPQDPRDEPARTLLGPRAISVEVPPFRLAEGWEWTSIDQLGDVLGGGTPSKSNGAFWEGAIPWVSPKDMKVPWLDDSEDHVTEAAVRGSAVKRIPPGAILMVVRGMILAHSFPVAATTVDVTVNQDMKALIPFRPELTPYALLMLQGSRDRVLGLVERSTHGTCKLPFPMLASLPLALPPISEQRRIVVAVEAFMRQCEHLEESLESVEGIGRQFADAAMTHLDVSRKQTRRCTRRA